MVFVVRRRTQRGCLPRKKELTHCDVDFHVSLSRTFRRCNPSQREEGSVCVNEEDGGRHLPDEHGHRGRRDLRPHHGCVRNPLSRERTLDTRSSRQILSPDLGSENRCYFFPSLALVV